MESSRNRTHKSYRTYWQRRIGYGLMDSNMSSVKRRLLKAGGWGIAKRLIKPIPIVGSVFAFGMAGYEIKRKGLLKGAIHVGLDATPLVGTAKNVVELFTGDLIPDKPKKIKLITPVPGEKKLDL
jgi:hypothetical protein